MYKGKLKLKTLLSCTVILTFTACATMKPIPHEEPRKYSKPLAETDPDLTSYTNQITASQLDPDNKSTAIRMIRKRIEILENATNFLNASEPNLHTNTKRQKDASNNISYLFAGTGLSALTTLIASGWVAFPVLAGFIAGYYNNVVSKSFDEEVKTAEDLNQKARDILSPPERKDLNIAYNKMVVPFKKPNGFDDWPNDKKEQEQNNQKDAAKAAYEQWYSLMDQVNTRGSEFVGVRPTPTVPN